MKIIVTTFLSFLFSVSYAFQPEKSETLSAKIILANTHGYYVLSDNTCWKVIALSQRWRSFGEWWHNVKLVPDCFVCTPADWDLGSPVELYPRLGFPGIPEENASNKETLNKCTHVFIHSRTKQVLFAIALETPDCMGQLLKWDIEKAMKKDIVMAIGMVIDKGILADIVKDMQKAMMML